MTNNPYLASQLSGPYAQALINAVQNEVVLASGEISYMYGFYYATVVSNILTTMGELVGFLWPVVPSGLIGGNQLFTFYTSSGTNPHFVAYSGFGSVISGTTLSGLLTSYYANSLIQQSVYAQLLPLAANLKYAGLTFANIDSVCQVFGAHTITFASTSGNNAGDIKVTFNPDISAMQLNVLNQIFAYYTTVPQVNIYNA
jgi:hypothetical protein